MKTTAECMEILFAVLRRSGYSQIRNTRTPSALDASVGSVSDGITVDCEGGRAASVPSATTSLTSGVGRFDGGAGRMRCRGNSSLELSTKREAFAREDGRCEWPLRRNLGTRFERPELAASGPRR